MKLNPGLIMPPLIDIEGGGFTWTSWFDRSLVRITRGRPLIRVAVGA